MKNIDRANLINQPPRHSLGWSTSPHLRGNIYTSQFIIPPIDYELQKVVVRHIPISSICQSHLLSLACHTSVVAFLGRFVKKPWGHLEKGV